MKKYVFSFIVVAAIALYYFMEVAPYTECEINHVYIRDLDKSELTIRFKTDFKFDSFSLGAIAMKTDLVRGTEEVNASWEDSSYVIEVKGLENKKGLIKVKVIVNSNLYMDFPKYESGGIVYVPATFYIGKNTKKTILRCDNAYIKTHYK